MKYIAHVELDYDWAGGTLVVLHGDKGRQLVISERICRRNVVCEWQQHITAPYKSHEERS